MTAADAKKQLRAQVRAQRRALPPEVLAADSRAITERLLALPEMERAERVFCYVSLPGEVETSPLIGRLLSQGRAVLVPRCRAGGEMDLVPISSLDDLTPGAYGILEPGPDLTPTGEMPDLAVVPALAFDRRGMRLGQGGGYYDRYLAGGHVPSILLCRERMLSPELPKEDWDLSFDWLLTEQGFWHQGRKEETCCVLR